MAAQPDDESKTGTLPDPELNPLLNPLLASNMGRWAEVYFTNPPEKRAQAVADLLRELEKNPPPERHPEPVTEKNPTRARESNNNNYEDVLLRRSFEPSDSEVVCASCGHPNRVDQRFCGMCGMPLLVNEESNGPTQSELLRQKSWHDQAPSEMEIHGELDDESAASYRSIPLPSFASLSAGGNSEDADGLFQYESQPARRNYRVYVGLGLAIILGLLVYKTWRSNPSFWAIHNAPSAPPPLAAAPVQPSAATPNPPPAAPPAEEQSANDNKAAASNDQPVAPKPEQAQPKRPSAQKAAVNHIPNAATGNATPANAAELNGAAELAVGQKYLNGGPGTARDAREASIWLWKAVAKQNPTATLLLSELYLRGDGVAKNCDQGRLLLDAAARKGNAAAAERLRNLPAFGCQ